MIDTYRDGVNVERCTLCQSALHSATDEPMVSLPISTLEGVLIALVEAPSGAWGPSIDVLERAVGRSYRQVKASNSA